MRTSTNKKIHPDVKPFPLDVNLPNSFDLYELAEQWNCTPENAWQFIANDDKWLIAGYNNFDQECYIKVNNDTI